MSVNSRERLVERRHNAEGAMPALMSELGATGLKHAGGLIDEEFLPQLRGKKAIKAYREMADNDPTVGAVLFAVEMLMREAPWTVEPASESSKDKKAAEFVQECLDDMEYTWEDTLAEILSFLTFGWSYHEVVYKRRKGSKSLHDDGKVGWAKIAPRSQDSLNQWVFDEKTGELLGMEQMAPPHYEPIFIPLTKSLLFRSTSRKSSPEGRSCLRNAYRPWHYLKRLEEIEAIGVERDLAGLPVAHVPIELLMDDKSDEASSAYNAMRDLVTRIKRDEQEGVLFPLVYDNEGRERYRLELLSSGGRRQFDTSGIIGRYAQQIAQTVLADFILLGHEAVGSFALSSDKTHLFSVALGAWMDSIADVFNTVAIPRLLDVNKMKGEVKLVPGDVEDRDLGQLGTYITQLSGAGMPLFPDEIMENHLREAANLPERPDDLDEKIAEDQQKKLEHQQALMGDAPKEEEEEDPRAGPALNAFRQRRGAMSSVGKLHDDEETDKDAEEEPIENIAELIASLKSEIEDVRNYPGREDDEGLLNEIREVLDAMTSQEINDEAGEYRMAVREGLSELAEVLEEMQGLTGGDDDSDGKKRDRGGATPTDRKQPAAAR